MVAAMSVGGDACALVFYGWVAAIVLMMVWPDKEMKSVIKLMCGGVLSLIGFCIERFGEKIGQTGTAMIDWDAATGLRDDPGEKFNDDNPGQDCGCGKDENCNCWQ